MFFFVTVLNMNVFRIRSFVLLAVALFGLGGTSTAFAQALKIGVVSVPRLLQDSPQAKATLDALQNEFAPRQRSIVAKEKDFKEKSERIQRDLAVLSEAEKRNAEKDLREDQRELARLSQEFVEDQNLRRNEELGTLQRTLLQQVDAFAKAGNYDLIIGDGVLFANQTVNITDQILATMESNYKKSDR